MTEHTPHPLPIHSSVVEVNELEVLRPSQHHSGNEGGDGGEAALEVVGATEGEEGLVSQSSGHIRSTISMT